MAKRPTTHKGHEPGFCDWVCFPKALKQEYAAKSGHDVSTPSFRADVEDRVVLWAKVVRVQFEGQPISEDCWGFWRARWRELELVDERTGRVVAAEKKTAPAASREAWRPREHPREYR